MPRKETQWRRESWYITSSEMRENKSIKFPNLLPSTKIEGLNSKEADEARLKEKTEGRNMEERKESDWEKEEEEMEEEGSSSRKINLTESDILVLSIFSFQWIIYTTLLYSILFPLIIYSNCNS